MNTLKFTKIIDSKFKKRQLSRLLKYYQFSCSEIQVKLKISPPVLDIHKYHIHESDCTLREDVITTVGWFTKAGYEVKVEVIINL